MYQPLTLLDCLHTFCGSCLKEWFSWQATSAVQARRKTNPYTCPSCRAEVRGTRPNATVTTLLDMFLTSNPGRGKSNAEKEEMRSHYKPGEDVIPPGKQESAKDLSTERRPAATTEQLTKLSARGLAKARALESEIGPTSEKLRHTAQGGGSG
jgi:hypothetical protein